MLLLFGVAAVITGFVAICLLFFQATRRTYPGFGYWTVGVGFFALGYLLYALRGQVPLWISVFGGTVAFPLGMVFHLDGIRRFLGLKPASGPWYAVPFAVLAGLAVFYFKWDSSVWRVVVVSAPVAAIHWAMAALLFRSAVSPRSTFYRVIGSLLAVGGLLVIARAIWLVSAPNSDLLWKAPLEFAFFTSFIVLHLGENLSLIMLNAERVESELVGAQKDLSRTVTSLREALSQQKQAEESLRDSEERYRTFFDTSRDAVFMTTLDGRFIDFNEAAIEMLGYAKSQRQEVLARGVGEFYAHSDERKSHAAIVAQQGFYKEYPVDLRRQDGTIFHTLITSVARKDSEGNVIGFQGTVRDVTDRKKAEEALRESEQRLSVALSGANFGIWEWDVNTGKAIWDDRSLSVLGYEPDEFEPNLKNWKKIVHPDDWPRVSENLNLHLEGKLPTYEVEYRILNKSGVWQWVLGRGNIVAVDEEGKPTRMAGVFADITMRKKTEEALRNSEAKYRFLAEHASDLIWTLDLNFRTTFVTPSVEKVLGFTPEERMLQNVEDQLTPESLEFARRRLFEELSIEREQGIQEGKSVLVELDYYHKNGSIVCLQTVVTFIRDEKGEPIGLHGISRDVTELARTQEALRESEERYRTVVEESFDGVFVHNGKVITFANSRLHEMLRYEPGELEGLDHWSICHPDSQELIRARARARLRGELVRTRFEVRLLRKNGTSFPVEVAAKVILFDNEPQTQIWIRDLTEQKHLQSRLVESQKMEAIGTLTGGIAHDFNNLLTIVNGYTEMLLLETAEDDPRYADLQKILETGRKGADMVQRLLAFSKKAEINPQPLNLRGIVANLVSLMRSTFPKMIEIETVFGKDLSSVNADATQIEQVLMNLCINAKEAMPEGGIIKIETRNTFIDEEYSRLHPGAKPGPYVLIAITDTGTGMSNDTRDRIFDPFFTTKGWDFKKGTGLSLPVTKGIVEQHDGWITCESEPSKGTAFRIYFPAIEDSPAVEKPKPLTEIVPGTEKILLVDDEELVRNLGRRILERAGYTALIAGNGKEALEIYGREHREIALVILDLIMPQMGGEKCLEELIKINPEVKVIVSTGHSIDERERDRLGALARGFVSKPYQLEHLLRSVRDALG
jgi:PAS domain S-box-containing protein